MLSCLPEKPLVPTSAQGERISGTNLCLRKAISGKHLQDCPAARQAAPCLRAVLGSRWASLEAIVQSCAQKHRNPQLLKGLLWGRGGQAAIFGVKFLQFLGKRACHAPGDWWGLPATEGTGNLCRAASSSERGSLLAALFASWIQWLYPSWS